MTQIRQVLDEYQLDRVLKTSVQTTVFLAADGGSGRRVVIKLINPAGPVAEEANRSRFLQAAQVAQSGVVRAMPKTLDFGFTPEHNAFLVTEWTEGLTPLSDIRGAPASTIVSILVGVLDSVDEFAMSGVSHLNLSPDNVLVTDSTVKLVGFGTAAYLVGAASKVWPPEEDRYAAPELSARAVLGRDDLWLADLYSITLMACDLLGARVDNPGSKRPTVTIPGSGKGTDRFASVAAIALRGDPATRDVTVSDLRRAMVKGNFDTIEGGVPSAEAGAESTRIIDLSAAQDRDVGVETVLASETPQPPEPPPPPAPSPPPLRAAAAEDEEVTTPSKRTDPSDRGRKPLWLLIGAAIAASALLVVVLVGSVVSRIETSEIVPEPTPIPPVPTRAPTPIPQVEPEPTIHSGLAEAARLLGEGDEVAAGRALEAITDEELEQFSTEENEIYNVVEGTLRGNDMSAALNDLRGGLNAGSIKMLRRGVAGLGNLSDAEIRAENGLGDDLDRARNALRVHKQLWDAKRADDHVGVLEHSRRMMTLLPNYGGASTLRRGAAEMIESVAEASIVRRDFEAALNDLEKIHHFWPEREGLVERMEWCRAEQGDDERMVAVLERAAAAGAAGNPEEGIRLLDTRSPSNEYADRYAATRRRLESQIVDLDVEPPRIVIPDDLRLIYKKNTTFVVPIMVTDDHGVELVVVYVKVGTETGYREIELPPNGDGTYSFEITPDLHDNSKVFFYFEASDGSGHTTELGSVTDPFILSKKGLFRR